MLSLFVNFGGYSVNYPGGGKFRWVNSDVGTILSELVKYIWALGGFALVFFIIKGGFELLVSGGDPKKIESGKGTITSSIFGFIILFSAHWIYEITTYILAGGPLREFVLGWGAHTSDIGVGFLVGKSPVSRFNTISVFLNPIINNAFILSSVIFFVLVIIGGFLFILNAGGGDKEGIEKNKSALTAAVLGFIIIFAVYWIVEIIKYITGVDIFNPPV